MRTKTPTASVCLLNLPVHQPPRPLHQRIHQAPHLMREYLNRRTSTPHLQPSLLDHNRQVIGHVDRVCGPDAPLAQNGLPNGQVEPQGFYASHTKQLVR